MASVFWDARWIMYTTYHNKNTLFYWKIKKVGLFYVGCRFFHNTGKNIIVLCQHDFLFGNHIQNSHKPRILILWFKVKWKNWNDRLEYLFKFRKFLKLTFSVQIIENVKIVKKFSLKANVFFTMSDNRKFFLKCWMRPSCKKSFYRGTKL